MIFEQMHLEEHIFAEAQRVINENRVVGEDGAAAGDQTVTEQQVARQPRLIRYSSEDMFKIRESLLMRWPDGLPKGKAWMG